ncbi:polyhydroxyalkanoic acid system family protein [Wenzhouxiangella marina]|uniref:Polyhydroxyalkanoic acid system protein n=1 Tax=Wenzhouxiangella marina TaxID=1579979 RepID=A0A0K0XY12_9GAMM|nr:polyhydroxyalkanoic acid system family protein [Wenzhouxiangella marina]AKS42565.1 Polyhydroxyalkanoic acid system protein [Wenzhouxiangella marina]MBB6085653.1 putative polyhydroxyalkanoate system protein [Wenzhouxiangella marina]
MAIDVIKTHGKTLEEAQKVADDLARDLADKFAVNYGWDGDTIVFERMGVHGEIDVNSEVVHVRAQLGFLLSYLEPAVEREVNRYLDEHFA